MAYLVLFEVAGQILALPAETLHKMVNPVPVTPLPFVTGTVEGLVSAGGAIVAQIDLGRRVGLTPRPDEPSALMLVRVAGRLVALRIAHLLGKAEIDEADIIKPKSSANPLIAGLFVWQERNVLLLHPDRVGLEYLTSPAIGQPVAMLGDPELRQPAKRPATTAISSSLVVRCGGEPYALPFELVQEVITAGQLTNLPHAPCEILGLTVLRHAPVLVLSLSRLLGKTAEAAASKSIPLVLIRHGAHGLALAVDAILGIRRLETADIHRMAEPQGGLAGYHVGANQSLTALLDLTSLLSGSLGQRLIAFQPASSLKSTLPPSTPEVKRRFLTFLIGHESYGIDIDRVDRLAEHRAPLPLPGHHHAALAGMVEIAGRVVPVADLRKPLGHPTAITRKTAFILTRGSRGMWAIVVDRLSRIVQIPVSAIKAAGSSHHFIAEIARLDRVLMPILDPGALDSIAM